MPPTAPLAPLIFDLDGTLADTMPAHYRAWQVVLGPLGIAFPEDRFYSWGGIPTPTIARMLVDEAVRRGVVDGLGQSLDVVALVKAKEDAFLGQLDAIVAIEPVVAIARAGRGVVPMAIASGGRRGIVERTLRQIGLHDWFGAVVTSEDTTRHKPEPDAFLEAARRLGVAPATCIVYEDSEPGLEAARRAGMMVVDVRKM